MARTAVKADFILSHPRDMPVGDLIKAGKKAGLGVLAKSYISKVRCAAPADTWAPKPPARAVVNGHSVGPVVIVDRHTAVLGRPGPAKRPIPDNWASTLSTPALQPLADTEMQLRRLFVIVGTERAQQLLDAYKAASEADLS